MRIRSSKSRSKSWPKLWHGGTYRTYFRNVKRKDKVIFDHSTTLTFCAENRRTAAKKCIHLRMPGV